MALRPQDLEAGMLYPRAWLEQQGMHPRQLASDRMTRALPGHFTRADAPADLREIALTVQRSVCPGAAISHETAAELFEFPLPQELTAAGGAPVHCRIVDGASARSSPLLTVHVRAQAPVIRYHGVTMSHPVVALQEIAPRLSRADLVAGVDALAANRFGTAYRVPLVEIRSLAASGKGRGAAALRSAVAEARERVWSPMETAMRLMVLGHGYPEPEPNRELIDPATGIAYYIDLAYPRWMIAIEYDGTEHRTDPQRWEADLHKNEVLHGQGWTVLRASVADLHRPGDFILRLDEAIRDVAEPRVTRGVRGRLVIPAVPTTQATTGEGPSQGPL